MYEKHAGLGVLAHGLSPAQCELLEGCARPLSLRGGERLFSEGDPAHRFYLVTSGVVAITLHVPHYGERVVETLLPGELVGWSWLQPPYRWRFSAVAHEPVTVREFDAARVRALCALDPALGQALSGTFLSVVAHRLHASRSRMLDLYTAEALTGR